MNLTPNLAGENLNPTEFEQKMKMLTLDVQKQFFPELKEYKIAVESHAPKDHFFQARFKFFGFFKHAKNRTYLIKYHTSCKLWPEPLVRAILVHEMSHILDFTKMSFATAFRFSWLYMLSNDFVARYERATDLQALHRAPILAHAQRDLKYWIYKLIGPEREKQYRNRYFTPEMIDLWIREHEHLIS